MLANVDPAANTERLIPRTFRAVVALAAVTLLGALGAVSTAAPAAATTESDEWAFLDLANQSRAQAGMPPLGILSPVRDLARHWSGVMASENRLYHNPNLGRDITLRLRDWTLAGENVGNGNDIGDLHQAFMNSPTHRANVLGDFAYVGVGVVRAGDGIWVTFNFVRAPAGLPTVSQAPPPVPSLPMTRIAGATDAETSLAVARRFPTGASDAVVVGRLDVFADALAGGPLAAVHHGPVLLTHPHVLLPGVLDEARRVLKPGGTVFLLGGPNALSPDADAVFAAAGLRTERLAGDDRFATAVAVARRVNSSPRDVLIVSGGSFADAMVAGAPGGLLGVPIVMTAKDRVPAVTADYLASVPGSTRVVVGGPHVVSDEVVRSVAAKDRMWGTDRYETSVRVAERWFGAAEQLSFATGVTFTDALAGSPFSARAGIPVVLMSDAPGQVTRDFVRSRMPQLRGTIVYGTPHALSDTALGSLLAR